MLFKILHGDTSRISTDITPFHEGYCYVTHDGYMYIDMNIGTEEEPNNQRVKLNADDAQTLLGKGIAEVLNNSEVEIPTSKAVWEAIAKIPTPDVSGQISTHNTSTSAHSDIRQAIANINIPVKSVNGKTGAVTLGASDVGASPAEHSHTLADLGAANEDHDHVVADITDFPAALKNPAALTVGSKTYDGSSAVSIAKSDIGLGNVDNKSSATIRDEITSTNVTKALGYTPAELDSSGKVPSSQLPSYVDDAVEGYFYNSQFYKESGHTTAITGETGKIYVDLSANKTYRWSGSAYVEISASLALGETSSTAYRGDKGKVAYEHSQSAHAPTNAEKNQNAFSNVTVGSTTIAADTTTDTLTLVAGSNVTITPDDANNTITINSGLYSFEIEGDDLILTYSGDEPDYYIDDNGHLRAGTNTSSVDLGQVVPDRQQIVNDVLAALPAAEGGSY